MSDLHSIPAPRAEDLQTETKAALLRTHIAGHGDNTGSRARPGLEDAS